MPMTKCLQCVKQKFMRHIPRLEQFELLKYLGPGFLVTVGFIDPGNWASNVAAGSQYGYTLLWMVTLSTIMLVILQHNAAHLGIVTGLCISEAATFHMPKWFSRSVLGSAVLASICTALAEILGGAIGLNMLTGLPLPVGAILTTAFVFWMLFSKGYRKIENIIIGMVTLIGISFLYELYLVKIGWGAAAVGWVTPAIPMGALPIVMSVLGAVVMPHNLYLHSEVIQSRQYNTQGENVIQSRLKYEFIDTLTSMTAGWAINSAMILLAAATFYVSKIHVTELQQAQEMLKPLLGNSAAWVFGLALLLSGLSSSTTAGMAGASIFAGIFGEAYDTKDFHTRVGICVTLLGGLLAVLLVSNPFHGLIISQMCLSIQLPWTIVLQIMLTSSRKVMGDHVNNWKDNLGLWTVAAIVIILNIMLLREMIFGGWH